MRDQKLKSAGVGIVTLAASNPWTGVVAAVGGTAISYYEQSQMDAIRRQEEEWLHQSIDQRLETVDTAKQKIQEYGSEFNKLRCNEIDF